MTASSPDYKDKRLRLSESSDLRGTTPAAFAGPLLSVSGLSTRVSQLDLAPGRVQRQATHRERILSLCYLLCARGWAISSMRSSLSSPSSAPRLPTSLSYKQQRQVRAISIA